MKRWSFVVSGALSFLLGLGMSELLRAKAQTSSGQIGRSAFSTACTNNNCYMYVIDTASGQTWTRRDVNVATWDKDRLLP